VLVDPAWLNDHLEDGSVVVLHVDFGLEAPDARGRLEYLDGHVPGARLVPWHHLVAKRGLLPNEIPPVEDLLSLVRRLGILPEHRVVLYDTGSGLEAARAYVTLDYLGLGPQLSLLDGQWKRWWREGRPVSRLPAEVESSYLPARLRPEVLVDRQAVRDYSWLAGEPESRGALIDSRLEEEFWGERPGKGVDRPGHIPGAKNLAWPRLLVGETDPRFKEEAELRRLFEAAGAEPGRSIVLYCRTGVQASLLYVAAKHLGYGSVMLYDGSYLDWISVPDLPVVNKWM
jgi:thiosulfate/3-mercaptopyruvate sulfurtransferase